MDGNRRVVCYRMGYSILSGQPLSIRYVALDAKGRGIRGRCIHHDKRKSNRHLESAAQRLAHLGDRPLQLPLHVLYAGGNFRAGLSVYAKRTVVIIRGNCTPRAYF